MTQQEEARLDQILLDWEKQSATVKTYKCDFTRLEFGTAFGFGAFQMRKIDAAAQMQCGTLAGLGGFSQPFGPELPAVAVNSEEIDGHEGLVIESAVEPAVISDGRVIQTARVIVKEGIADVSGD